MRALLYTADQCALTPEQATFVGLFSAQLVLLVLRSQDRDLQSHVSLAADSLTVVATVCALGILVLNYERCHRPSTALSIYVSASGIMSIARTRTLWLISSSNNAPLSATACVIFFALAALGVEFTGRKQKSTLKSCRPAPEHHSGFWSRTTFTWLWPLYRMGYSKIIYLDDLFALDTKIDSAQVHQDLVQSMQSSAGPLQGRFGLLIATSQAFAGSALSGALPRLCLTFFTFCQPFLLSKTVDWVGQVEPERAHGNGLIVAWTVILLGIAVSTAVS